MVVSKEQGQVVVVSRGGVLLSCCWCCYHRCRGVQPPARWRPRVLLSVGLVEGAPLPQAGRGCSRGTGCLPEIRGSA